MERGSNCSAGLINGFRFLVSTLLVPVSHGHFCRTIIPWLNECNSRSERDDNPLVLFRQDASLFI